MQPYFVYILVCSDGSYYTGVTASLELRLAQHQTGFDPRSYTHSRRPVRLAWSEAFPSEQQARERERQIKGWSRAKKEALIAGDYEGIRSVVKGKRIRRWQARHRSDRTSRRPAGVH